MKFFAGALRVFGYIWLTLGCLLILIGIIGVWHKDGFGAVQDLLSPFNVVNYIAVVVTLAPGLGALIWSDKLKQKLAHASGAT